MNAISPSRAQEIRDQSIEQFGHLLLDEKEAKLAMVTGMVMGENIMLYGLPGGGKTTLGRDAYRVIEGVTLDDVATIPIESDLTPERLIGGTASITKSTTLPGETVPVVENTSSVIEPIIGKNSKVVFANEINRISPYAINASLEALETRVIDTSAGTVSLAGLEYVVSTMNPLDTRSGTFPITGATASRHAIGIDLGNNISDESLDKIENSSWTPRPDLIVPVVDLADLHAAREGIAHLATPDNLKPYSRALARGILEGLASERIASEALPRLHKQLGKTAKTLALLGGQEVAGQENFDQAAKFVVAARVGALARKDPVSTVDKIVDQAKNGSFNSL